jgi:2-polyprenyl-3-methyl-5-hydroxy-6-metoxy-1,4-benzoquinol methylase
LPRLEEIDLEALEGLSEQEYLERIAALSFEGVEWTPERIAAVRDFFTPWHHNIKLADGIYTVYQEAVYTGVKEIMRVLDQAVGGDYAGKRVIDIGCNEGYFSAECALHGADVLGIEARLINIKKLEFVKSVLGIPTFRFARDEADAVTHEKYGSFDIALVLGLLYHLEEPFTLLENVAQMCDGFVLIDTLISFEDQPDTLCGDWKPELTELQDFTFRGRIYTGRLHREYESSATQAGKDLAATSSLGHEWSMWLTEDSLLQLLRDVGFEQIVKLVYPKHEDMWWADVRRDARVLLMATKTRSDFRSRIFT